MQSALPYFLNCNANTIEGKGFTGLKVFKTNTNLRLKAIVDSSRTGMVIPVLLKPENLNLTCKDFFNITYKALVDEEATMTKNLDKCLIINATETELNDLQLQNISEETARKREYKHNLLDYLVYLLDNFDNSTSMHQEIGRYLGVNKHLLNKIHKTESGIWVVQNQKSLFQTSYFVQTLTFNTRRNFTIMQTNGKSLISQLDTMAKLGIGNTSGF